VRQLVIKVLTFRLGYKNQSVYAVSGTSRRLFWYIKEVYTSYCGREISLLTNYVTVQFLYIHFRIKMCGSSCKN